MNSPFVKIPAQIMKLRPELCSQQRWISSYPAHRLQNTPQNRAQDQPQSHPECEPAGVTPCCSCPLPIRNTLSWAGGGSSGGWTGVLQPLLWCKQHCPFPVLHPHRGCCLALALCSCTLHVPRMGSLVGSYSRQGCLSAALALSALW